jgi:rhodanese-related sulfurtransferase
MRSVAVLLLLLSLSISSSASAGIGLLFDRTWPKTLQEIEREFPGVKHISSEQFANRYAKDQGLIVLDIRERDEYRVSHLQNAVLAPNSATALKRLKDVRKDRPIVVYCSVGWRSSEAATALQRAGYTNVMNLRGGIFTWANEKRPVFRQQQAVRQVHPFNKDWGRLLNAEYRSKVGAKK